MLARTNFFLVVSLLGFTISMTAHLLAVFAGVFVGNDLIGAMMVGCFPIAGFAFFFQRDAEERGTLPWRSILRWPGWLKLVIGALFLYVLWFSFTNRLPARWGVGSEPLSPLLVQASCLVLAWLYALCCALLYDTTPRIESRTGSIAEARAIQAALGLDASQEANDFYGLSWLLTRNVFTIAALLLIAAAMFVGLTTGPPHTFIGQGLAGIGVLMFLVPTRIRVGARGISLRWLWFGRFIGYDAIDDVAVYQHTHVWNWFESGLWIRTSAGSLRLPIRLHYSRVVRQDRAGATDVALVWERIREAALVLRGSASPNAAQAEVVGADDDGASAQRNKALRPSP